MTSVSVLLGLMDFSGIVILLSIYRFVFMKE